MTMTRVAIAVTCGLLIPVASAAQPRPRIEVSGSAAATKVFRVEDQSFGTTFGPGAALEWRVLRNLGLGLEVNRATGLENRVVGCGGPPGTVCVGTAREGVLSTTLMSVTAAWYFEGSPYLQPYVVGGLDVMWSRTLSSITFARDDVRTISEFEQSDRGMGVTAGAGVRIPVGLGVFVRPEWRVYDGSLLGRANLSAMRTSVAVGYRW
jgi:opacity protein-like surface antigen